MLIPGYSAPPGPKVQVTSDGCFTRHEACSLALGWCRRMATTKLSPFSFTDPVPDNSAPKDVWCELVSGERLAL